jgi:hypothetical protein
MIGLCQEINDVQLLQEIYRKSGLRIADRGSDHAKASIFLQQA